MDIARARRLIDGERKHVVELARAASLAVRIEPSLLRALRVRFVRGADASAEADLWFGPLVEFQSPQGILLHPAVAGLLRKELRRDARRQEIWGEIEKHHAGRPFLVQLEERLAWLACSEPGDGPIDSPLHSILATMQREPTRARDLGAWFLRALPRLPERVKRSSAAWALALGAGAKLEVTPLLDAQAPSGVAELLPPELLPPAEHDIPIAVERLGAKLHFGPPKAGSHVLHVPATTPLFVEVHADGQSQGVAFAQGERASVDVRGATVRLRTLRGDEHELRPATPVRHEAPSDTRVSIGELPAVSAAFVGRVEELALLDRAWLEGARVIVISGFVGIGKTELVSAWLAHMEQAGWRGATRVFARHLNGNEAVDDVLDEALAWFGGGGRSLGSAEENARWLADLLRHQRSLIVLDGIHRVLGGPTTSDWRLQSSDLERVVRELSAEGSTTYVITTRLVPAGVGQRQIRHIDLGGLSTDDGARVLRAAGVKGTDTELGELVNHQWGNPLALDMLAQTILRVNDGDVRWWREHAPVGDHIGLAQAYETWFGEGPENAILRFLSFFDGPVDEDELRVLRRTPIFEGLNEGLYDPEAWTAAFASLARASLVQGAFESVGLDVQPTVREFWGRRLRAQSPEAFEEGHRRLFDHYMRGVRALTGSAAVMSIGTAVVHGCLAGHHAAALGAYRTRARQMVQVFPPDTPTDFSAEARLLSAFFDPPWQRLAEGLEVPDQLFLLGAAGAVLVALGRLEEAESIRRAADSLAAHQDRASASRAAERLASLLAKRGDLEDAESFAHKADELSSESDDHELRVECMATYARVLHQMGHRKQALDLFERAEDLQQRSRSSSAPLGGAVGFHYASLLLDAERYDEVIARASTAHPLEDADRDLLSIALDDLSLGVALLRQPRHGGSHERAREPIQRAESALRRSNRQDYIPFGLLAHAELLLQGNGFEPAKRDLDAALFLATRAGMRLHETDLHLAYARLYLAQGQPSEARVHLDTAKSLIADTGYHRRDLELAQLLAATGARAHFSPERLDALHAAAATSDLLPDQDVLLSGLDKHFVAQLPTNTTNLATRLSATLTALNAVQHLADGSVPIERWLRNALVLTGDEVFATALTDLAPSLRDGDAPASPASSVFAGHLSFHRIHQLYFAAPVLDQDVLLSGIDRSFVASLRSSRTLPPNKRLLANLFEMNEVEALSDGSVPIRIWLQHALAVTHDDIFRRPLAEVSQGFLPAEPDPGLDARGLLERARAMPAASRSFGARARALPSLGSARHLPIEHILELHTLAVETGAYEQESTLFDGIDPAVADALRDPRINIPGVRVLDALHRMNVVPRLEGVLPFEVWLQNAAKAASPASAAVRFDSLREMLLEGEQRVRRDVAHRTPPARHLADELIFALHLAVMESSFIQVHEVLLGGLDPWLVDTMLAQEPRAPNAGLLTILHHLNQIGRLENGVLPFEVWLLNARALLRPTRAVEVVERALADLRGLAVSGLETA